MPPHPDPRQHVRHVTLPSGKQIEVVYFDGAPGTLPTPGAALRKTGHRVQELHLCGHCGSDLVFPVAWEEAGRGHWQVTLRCPNCEWARSGIFEQATIDRFDEALELGTEELIDDLRCLMRANMEEEIERFAHALDADAIVPSDF